jgi:hypothetical protein
MRLALVETLNEFNDILSGHFTRDGNIVVNRCGSRPKLIAFPGK